MQEDVIYSTWFIVFDLIAIKCGIISMVIHVLHKIEMYNITYMQSMDRKQKLLGFYLYRNISIT